MSKSPAIRDQDTLISSAAKVLAPSSRPSAELLRTLARELELGKHRLPLLPGPRHHPLHKVIGLDDRELLGVSREVWYKDINK